ncbi:MAG: PIN domain-containing protein [bacterium]
MPEKPRIYIESAPFIDLVKSKVGVGTEANRARAVFFVEQALEAARAGDVEVFTSTLTIAECTHVNDPLKLEAAKPFFMGLLGSGKMGIRLIQTTSSVVERARDLRWFSGVALGGADSVHVASALHLRCDELWTGDGKMLAQADVLLPLGLRVCKPSLSSCIPEKYLQSQFPL